MAFFKKRPATSEQAPEHVRDDSAIEKENSTVKEYARPQTRLVFPEGKDELPNELRYVMQFVHSELPPLEEGVISIDGYKLEQGQSGFTVTAFVRNNTEEEVHLTYVPLLLFDADNNLIARRVFNLDGMELEPKTAIAYPFDFYYEHFVVESFNPSSWYVAFHMQGDEFQAVTPTLSFETEEKFSIQDKHEESYRQARDHAMRILEETQGQINFIRGGTSVSEEGNLQAEVYIRNGREEEVRLPESLICTVFDARQEEVASASFDLSELVLPPSSVTAYTLTYVKSQLKKQNPDLSDWSIKVEE